MTSLQNVMVSTVTVAVNDVTAQLVSHVILKKSPSSGCHVSVQFNFSNVQLE